MVRDVGHDRLVLTACHPLYSAAERLVVFARLIDVAPPAGAGAGRSSGPARRAPEIDAPGPGPALAGLGGLAGIAAFMVLLGARRARPSSVAGS